MTRGGAHQALERPGQPGGGGLVAGREQGHQLVAELDVGHRTAVLVPRREQQRQHVLARLGLAARGDLGVDQLVHGRQGAPEASRG